jgi:hypothetical protein
VFVHRLEPRLDAIGEPMSSHTAAAALHVGGVDVDSGHADVAGCKQVCVGEQRASRADADVEHSTTARHAGEHGAVPRRGHADDRCIVDCRARAAHDAAHRPHTRSTIMRISSTPWLRAPPATFWQEPLRIETASVRWRIYKSRRARRNPCRRPERSPVRRFADWIVCAGGAVALLRYRSCSMHGRR